MFSKPEKHTFTLVEIITVLAIMLIIAGIVTSSALKKPSSVMLRSSSAKITEVLSGARARAILQNKVKYVSYDEKAKLFSAGDAGDKKTELKAKLPDEVTVELPGHSQNQKWSYCFYPDGTGAGPEIVLTLNQYKTRISLSPLTGMVFVKDVE